MDNNGNNELIMIDRKFLFFKTREGFDRSRREIQDESVVFIQGETPADRAIWTHGVFFQPSTGTEHSKGFFESYQALYNAWPSPVVGDWAIVADNDNLWVFDGHFPVTFYEYNTSDWYIYTCSQRGIWTKTKSLYNNGNIDLSQYLKKDDINLDQYVKHNELNLEAYLTKAEAYNTYINNTQIQNFLTKQDLNNLATKTELNNYVKKTDLKTINGESIIGTGNIVIQTLADLDLSQFITKEQFDNYNKLLSVQITSVNPELFEYTGNSNYIVCTYVVKKGSDLIVPDSITINGVQIQPESSGSFMIEHNVLGKKNITITVSLDEETATATKSSTSVRPTYYGFNSSSSAGRNILSSLTKTIVGSVKMNLYIPNTISGSYLWIVTPFTINKVAVDENFTYPVSMEAPITINGLNYYRSKQQIDICELTYYIK